jgi:hypothetical protein
LKLSFLHVTSIISAMNDIAMNANNFFVFIFVCIKLQLFVYCVAVDRDREIEQGMDTTYTINRKSTKIKVT